MEERAHRRRIWAENAAIFFLGAFALFLFCVSFFPSLAAAQRVQASLEMGRMVERAFSVALFFLATRLYRRLRAAHTAAMAVFVLHLLRGLTARPVPLWTMAVDVILLVLFFLWTWNDFLMPNLYVSDSGLRTLTVAIYMFKSTSGSEWNLMLAGMTLSMVPIIIIYIAAQKYITSGLTAGAVKM